MEGGLWPSSIVGQHPANQPSQVLEQRATAHKAELVQARAQAAAAEETLAAERRDRARLAEEAAAREQDVKVSRIRWPADAGGGEGGESHRAAHASLCT